MTGTEIADPVFGAVLVTTTDDGAHFSVSGESIPPADIVRTRTIKSRSDIPIGTRDGEAVRLTVEGNHFTVHPGAGRFSRRSYRVLIAGSEQSWLYTPASPTGHRLVRGTRYDGHNEIGIFTAWGTEVTVEWSREIRFAGAVARSVEPDGTDCALGYLLAAAFGTGAQLMAAAVLGRAVEAIFPP